MKKSRFTDSQIIDALKRAETGLAVPELCRELGISAATFYKWRCRPSLNFGYEGWVTHQLHQKRNTGCMVLCTKNLSKPDIQSPAYKRREN